MISVTLCVHPLVVAQKKHVSYYKWWVLFLVPLSSCCTDARVSFCNCSWEIMNWYWSGAKNGLRPVSLLRCWNWFLLLVVKLQVFVPTRGLAGKDRKQWAAWTCRSQISTFTFYLNLVWTFLPISGGIGGFSQGRSFTINWPSYPSNLSSGSLCGWFGFILQMTILLSIQADPRRADM